MRVISVQVGLPRRLVAGESGTGPSSSRDEIRSGIVKLPVEGPVRVGRMNLEGDGQADLRVHGGRDKAVYGYPCEHYEFWRSVLPDVILPPGSFGENLTVEGMFEGDVQIGDLFRIGTAELRVTQPRLPCAKLGVRMRQLIGTHGGQRADARSEDDMVEPGVSSATGTGRAATFDEPVFLRRFLETGRTGFYFSVEGEGEIQAGDPVQRIGRGAGHLSVLEAVRLHRVGSADPTGLHRAIRCPHLSESWRRRFREAARARASEESP